MRLTLPDSNPFPRGKIKVSQQGRGASITLPYKGKRVTVNLEDEDMVYDLADVLDEFIYVMEKEHGWGR